MLRAMDVLSLYREAGAYFEGHFLLASGRHSPKFLQSALVLQHPPKAEQLGAALAALFPAGADFVIGPALGGVVLAHTVARALGCRAIFAEKDGHGGMLLHRFPITPGERFIAVEDVVTTGGSLRKTIAAAEAAGAVCLGVGALIDRGQAVFTPPLQALIRLEFPSYPAEGCPLCRAGLPLEQP
ncbi:MAG: orotate phosphoribosyltransferase [Truepera sp.]|nr:orotate phosphoribosyltransferase [Truepera sp.]